MGALDRHMHQTPPDPCSEHVSLSNGKEAELPRNYGLINWIHLGKFSEEEYWNPFA